ncbi:hypothetical protein Gpo141_00000426 [Globisporangium polare]
MAPAAPSPSPSSSKPKLLPHQLVARDARSTYIQRVQTLAGPGAYVIPSTFQQQQATQLNDKLRDVHQSQYGREFARKQRGQQRDGARLEQATSEAVEQQQQQQRSVTLNKYRMRRDHLRAMLQRGHHNNHSSESWGREMSSPESATATNRATTALSMSPSPSCYDAFVAGYRHQDGAQTTAAAAATACAQVAPLDLRLAPASPSNASSYSELEEIELSIEDLSGADAVCVGPRSSAQKNAHADLQPVPQTSARASAAMTPLSYAQFLSSTSYARRRLQKPKKRSCSQ